MLALTLGGKVLPHTLVAAPRQILWRQLYALEPNGHFQASKTRM
jgi:hypothetical protein